MPTGQSEAVNQRRTDTAVVNNNRTKGKTTSDKTLHRKINIEQHEPY
jgi:hypothetical protein